MADKKRPLAAEHQQLKRETEALRVEHEQLSQNGATLAEHRAHRVRLRDKRLELEAHYTRLRQLEQRRQIDRQRMLTDPSEEHRRD